ncbi:Cof-type HAD-IIB family hydrolase [Alkalibacillus haloalkaliphilus]|uniref:5-amino-6-(5-phospho-D-ribitylamino)uracil phosphatase YitU n=1 Tax=Alkalibacillus haloalkaliphilus TaxID=94136 RepID=A0A511W4E9_9BACI|nr:Cof-type HAD-IIB family hydrolase [Alkalibacillus haloalkaliphilus]GEN45661.1 5-amino-6-(5-phospho-D-ribitylamino)uracil phosphatase YitU [Alkalibacillus haloalkaliphilus]
MKQQHLIALDLDGTLLNDNKVISERTLKTIEAAKQEGHIVAIATGRPYRVSKQFYHQMALDTPIVNMNGALIHHPKQANWDHMHSPLPKDVAHDIVETCYNVGVQNILAEIMDEVYIEYDNQHDITHFFQAGLEQPATFGKIQENLAKDPSSVLIHPFDDRVDQIRQTLTERHATIVDHRKWGAPFHVIEVIRSNMHKAVGVQKIAQEYGIPKDRIIAFGDEDNDFEMIDYAGVGVAMGNGIDELKSMANEITTTNHDDGVAQFLEEYLSLPKSILTKKV